MTGPAMPGGRYAMNIIHPGSPMLRIRYRRGVLVDPYGFPDWVLYARALVELPPPVPELTVDETRVVDVLSANAALVAAGDDPLWTVPVDGAPVPTPAGWCWAHLGTVRQVALVPVELHGAYRHAGGVRRLPGDGRRGVRTGPGTVGLAGDDEVPDEVLADLELLLGYRLPPAYRRFLGATNGSGPVAPGVLAGFGFVADQPLFGIARADRHQDLSYAPDWLRDRFTTDFLPIGYVQGGVLAVRVAGPDADAVWYLDDDDPRDEAGFDAPYLCGHLLRRCADDIDAYHLALAPPADALLDLAAEQANRGLARPVRDDAAGAGLPAALRAPWQQPPAGGADPVVALFDVP